MAVIVEDKLEALFALIPERSFEHPVGKLNIVPKPTYDHGDTKECNMLINLNKGDVYPLIFQTSTEETQNVLANSVTTSLVLVICTRTHDNLLNRKRWATSYKNVIMPLVDDVYKALNESGIVRWENQYTLEKLPNYSETPAKDKNAFIDIVDAVIFRATITISGKGCINKTIFNN